MDPLEIFLKKYPGGSIKDYREFLSRRDELQKTMQYYQEVERAKLTNTLTAKQYRRYCF